MEAAITIRQLAFTYKDQTKGKALDGIDLDIARGEFLMIVGPSGAGKTTLVNCLNGIIPNMVRGQYEGTVTLNGKETAKQAVSHMARDIGLVFQDFENQLFSTNVRLEIAFSPENFSFPREEMDGIIDEILKLIGDVMPEADLPKGGPVARVGAIVMIVSIVVCLPVALFFAYQIGGTQALPVMVIAGIGAIGCLIGGALMN